MIRIPLSLALPNCKPIGHGISELLDAWQFSNLNGGTMTDSSKIFMHNVDGVTVYCDYDGKPVGVMGAEKPKPTRGASITDTEKFRRSMACHEKMTKGLQQLREEEVPPWFAFVAGGIIGGAVAFLVVCAVAFVAWRA